MILLNFNFKLIGTDKKTGKKIESPIFNNVVDTGLDAVADLIAGEFTYLAIGTGTTAVTTGDTELETEYTRESVSFTDEGTGIRQVDHTFNVGSGVSEDITEVGLFNSATPSGSTMLNRAVDSAFTLDLDNPLRVIGTITVTTS